MALLVRTNSKTTGQALLAHITKEIKNGNLDTWGINYLGGFVHTRPQWNKGAYLDPSLSNDDASLITFRYAVEEGSDLTDGTVGVLQGRFLQALINHFNTYIKNIGYVDRRQSAAK